MRLRAPVTLALLLAWIALYALALGLSGGPAPSTAPWQWGAPRAEILLRLGAEVPSLVRDGAWPRVVTAAFLHAFLLHLVLNGWVWLSVGRLLEAFVGSARTFVVFVVSVLGGGIAHAALSDAWAVGASGGVFGAVGALGVWSLRSRRPEAAPVRSSVLFFLLLSVLLVFVPGVAHEAHVGGLVSGAVAMAVLGPRRSDAPPGRAVRGVALALLGVVLVAGGLQAAEARGGPTAEQAQDLLRELHGLEDLGRTLQQRPDLARADQRADLARRIDLVAATPWLDAWPGADALRELLGAWRPVARGDVPRPWEVEQEIEAARAAFAPWRQRLRTVAGSGP